MQAGTHVWVVVLAAGDGTRLAGLTIDGGGRTIPKQYCSLNGGDALVAETVSRARTIVPEERVCVVVAKKHCDYWLPALTEVPLGNIIVQPENRGTANGVLLATLTIASRDPLAVLMFMPADHFIQDEDIFVTDLIWALRRSAYILNQITLIGMEPESADCTLGYIVAGPAYGDGTYQVAHFLEKPDARLALLLWSRGALWNTFLFFAHAEFLVRVLTDCNPHIADAMVKAIARATATQNGALVSLYERLPTVDFSRAVLQGSEQRLRVVRSRTCGWTDLGEPRRVALALKRTKPRSCRGRAPFDFRHADLPDRDRSILDSEG